MTQQLSNEWVRGDLYGLDIPANIETLMAEGETFLTLALRSSGALVDGQSVVQIIHCEPFNVGGTGSKARLTVQYEPANTPLPTQLFIKFSRNFSDRIRDRSSHMMVSEVQFAALSRSDGFPITVPLCLFADVQEESATGLMITETIPFSEGNHEPQCVKCMDYQLQDPVAYYRCVFETLGRFSGQHKAVKLAQAFYRRFEFDAGEWIAADAIFYQGEKLQRRLQRILDFINQYPRLFPDKLRDKDFQSHFIKQATAVVAKEGGIKNYLATDENYIALCHWNANLDNAWFWRDENDDLHCGLMDWGRVGLMPLAQTIYGALSGAQVDVWDKHFDELLELFVDVYHQQGAPEIELKKLKQQTVLMTAMMGLAYLMDAPAIMERQLPDLAVDCEPQDQCFQDNEDARIQLHMLTMFLNQWRTQSVPELVASLFPDVSHAQR